MCHSKKLVLLDSREDFELEKTYFYPCIYIFIDLSCSDMNDELEVIRQETS